MLLSELSLDKALHCGDGVAVSMMEGLQVSFPLSQIVELNNSIQKHLMLILVSSKRGKCLI